MLFDYEALRNSDANFWLGALPKRFWRETKLV